MKRFCVSRLIYILQIYAELKNPGRSLKRHLVSGQPLSPGEQMPFSPPCPGLLSASAAIAATPPPLVVGQAAAASFKNDLSGAQPMPTSAEEAGRSGMQQQQPRAKKVGDCPFEIRILFYNCFPRPGPRTRTTTALPAAPAAAARSISTPWPQRWAGSART